MTFELHMPSTIPSNALTNIQDHEKETNSTESSEGRNNASVNYKIRI